MQALQEFLHETGAEEGSRVLQVDTPQWAPPHLLARPDPPSGTSPQC